MPAQQPAPLKVSILGGGPAGLYFAILLKKARPECRIALYERNRADDTFGFGVVFSDQTLDIFRRYDPESHAAILANFAYWDDIAVSFQGRSHPRGRQWLLRLFAADPAGLLQERAAGAGRRTAFRTGHRRSGCLRRQRPDRGRRRHQQPGARALSRIILQPAVDLRPNKFVWLGSTRPFDAFTFFFRETEHGVFIAHCYQYEQGHSTWVIETDPETWSRAGLAADERSGVRALSWSMSSRRSWTGHTLITNRSLWRNFPMIRNTRWVKDNIVLLGDAKATAHFSIGAGTKLAMEDAIALFEAFRKPWR